MKIADFKRDITPALPCLVAGYGFTDKAQKIRDNLYMTGLCCDDGENKVLIISFDLLGLDEWFIKRVRKNCAEILGVTDSAVLFTCTHNHSGPQTICAARHEETENIPYLEMLEAAIYEEVRGMTENYVPCDVYFYSLKVDQNRNRRYTAADNMASFTPHRREMLPLAGDFADQEFGALIFTLPDKHDPIYAIGNYAAHPLAGHSPGLGGYTISADFPGAFRDYVTEESGAGCMYISGASGDMVPRQDELGSDGVKQMGVSLGKAMLAAMIDAPRNSGRFKLDDPKVGSLLTTFTAPLRRRYYKNPNKLSSYYVDREVLTEEIQIVSIGDIAFVGLPSEPCAELGQEIKWHSPFKKTYIAYCSTSFAEYIVPANFFVSGGYEPMAHFFSARNTIDFVKCAVDGLFALHDDVFPTADGEEPYPDGLDLPLVNILPNKKN
ncbi:MAG: hypothetical protein E7463_08420 [Ruminococcaceae bacterium]|nr:hypothetical protein [Oscillospiraceae bacterium]